MYTETDHYSLLFRGGRGYQILEPPLPHRGLGYCLPHPHERYVHRKGTWTLTDFLISCVFNPISPTSIGVTEYFRLLILVIPSSMITQLYNRVIKSLMFRMNNMRILTDDVPRDRQLRQGRLLHGDVPLPRPHHLLLPRDHPQGRHGGPHPHVHSQGVYQLRKHNNFLTLPNRTQKHQCKHQAGRCPAVQFEIVLHQVSFVFGLSLLSDIILPS